MPPPTRCSSVHARRINPDAIDDSQTALGLFLGGHVIGLPILVFQCEPDPLDARRGVSELRQVFQSESLL